MLATLAETAGSKLVNSICAIRVLSPNLACTFDWRLEIKLFPAGWCFAVNAKCFECGCGRPILQLAGNIFSEAPTADKVEYASEGSDPIPGDWPADPDPDPRSLGVPAVPIGQRRPQYSAGPQRQSG